MNFKLNESINRKYGNFCNISYGLLKLHTDRKKEEHCGKFHPVYINKS